MFSNYQQVLSYLYEALPMFQRIGAVAYKKDLTNTLALCQALGNPHLKFKSVHVAGTNGKGSTSHMLASVLQSSGYTTGLYTSPHLKNFTERIKVNGAEISQEFVVDFVNRIKPEIERIKPSFFEITVAMAFDYFSKCKVDIAVIEVGLGGRLDSTNVIIPEVSVITNIGFDHKDLLGDTLEKIAFEKAGIIKSGVPVVISQRQPEIEHVFKIKASEVNAELYFASDEYNAALSIHGVEIARNNTPYISNLQLPLKGNYQTKNLPGVLRACDQLNTKGFTISKESLVKGLEQTVAQTGLKGRWQQLSTNPLIICDTGHNVDGIKQIVAQLKQQSFNTLHIVLGMVKDKDQLEVLALLPTHASYYFCQAKIPRALDATVLSELAHGCGLKGVVIADVNEAIQAAKRAAKQDDLIFIGGSTFVVAEIEAL
jgi:dihydrofolate synthase / folylpolyglutamate synthase